MGGALFTLGSASVYDCVPPPQPLADSEDTTNLMASRTRSKRPLRDVPLDLLEAELRAPDITPDMYDSGSAQEDREWTDWLRGLMTTDMDNEGLFVCVCIYVCEAPFPLPANYVESRISYWHLVRWE